MSLTPRCPISLFDQNFGLGLLTDDLCQPWPQPLMLRAGYYRPWRHLARQQSGTSSVTNDKDKFQVNLDVQQFKPDEVTVKTVDNAVVVEGKHEEKEDEHGYISRQFVRRYVLPDGVDVNQVQCNLSSDGVLNISVPKKVILATSENERVVPISQTASPPAVQPAHFTPPPTCVSDESHESDDLVTVAADSLEEQENVTAE